MPYQNLVIVLGHLTAPPELRYLPNGKPVANFTVAVNESWTDDTGQKKEKATFIRCNVFGGWAENAAKMDKGALCYVRGKLSQDSWEDKETGQKREKTYVQAQEVYGFDRNGAKAAAAAKPVKPAPKVKQGTVRPNPDNKEANDDDVAY